jgi:hypothetical protein
MLRPVAAMSVLAMAFCASPLAAPPPKASLCTPAEDVIFQCDLKGKRLSLCASRDFSTNGGTVQYRYGVPAKMELLYPETPQPARDRFFFSSTPYSGGGEAHIRFSNGDYDYILFDRTVRTAFGNGPNNPEFTSGVVTRRKGTVVSRRLCSNNGAIVSKAYEALPKEEFEDIE